MKAVLCDFDGTLFALRTDYDGLRRALEAEARSAGTGSTGRVGSFLEDAMPQRPGVLALLARYEAEGAKRGAFLPDAPDFLARLNERGVRWAVYTRNCRLTVLGAFGAAGLPEPHALVAIDDDVPPKPHPDATALVLRRLGVSPRDCVVVGDSEHDMAVGAALGITRVLRTPDATLVRAEADVVVRSLDEIDLDRLLA